MRIQRALEIRSILGCTEAFDFSQMRKVRISTSKSVFYNFDVAGHVSFSYFLCDGRCSGYACRNLRKVHLYAYRNCSMMLLEDHEARWRSFSNGHDTGVVISERCIDSIFTV